MNIKKVKKLLFFLITMIFLLGACGKNEDKENILKEVTYNVVYMGEDSNLEEKIKEAWNGYSIKQ